MKTTIAGLAMMMLVPASSPAALAVFSDGRTAKIADYRVEGDDIEIFLPGGGSYTTSLLLVERIVDDEVPPAPEEIKDLPTARTAATYDLSYKPARRPLFQTEYDRVIEAECRKFDVDASFVSAVIKAESNYDPYARSRKGARGLMQLMPSTARRMGIRRTFDPISNIRGGVKYLKELCQRFTNKPELILAAYNAGEQAVDLYGGVPPYRETVEYVKRILRWWSPAPKSPSV
jgi:hypothetical protein